MRKEIRNRTGFNVYNTIEGETIEMKVERIVNNGEAIEDIAPTIYQPRREGVRPEYDIRTDRFEVAIDAMGAVEKSMITRRENYHKSEESESTEGTQK